MDPWVVGAGYFLTGSLAGLWVYTDVKREMPITFQCFRRETLTLAVCFACLGPVGLLAAAWGAWNDRRK